MTSIKISNYLILSKIFAKFNTVMPMSHLPLLPSTMIVHMPIFWHKTMISFILFVVIKAKQSTLLKISSSIYDQNVLKNLTDEHWPCVQFWHSVHFYEEGWTNILWKWFCTLLVTKFDFPIITLCDLFAKYYGQNATSIIVLNLN